MRVKLDYTPLPTQAKFHASGAKYKLYAGGFGSGKTTALVYEALLLALEYPNSTGMIARQTYRELYDTTMKEFFAACPPELIRNFNKSTLTLTLWNGSDILFRNLDKLDKRKGVNLGWIGIDELSEVSEAMWLELMGRIRQRQGPRKMFAVMNANGHSWQWRRWIRDAHKNKDYAIFQADIFENPYLPKDYVQSLIDNYPEQWVKRYVYGSWDAAAGIIYEELDWDTHVINPFPIPNHWKRVVGMDYGYTNPTAVLWAAIDPKTGNIYVYDEHYAAKLTVSQHKTIIKAKTGMAKVIAYPADPSIWRAADGEGRSIADEFMSPPDAIPLVKANNSVAQGINRVKELLIQQKLFIFRSCENLLEEIQDYRYEDIPPNKDADLPEKPRKVRDHACDALRYLVAYVKDHNLAPTDYYIDRGTSPTTQLVDAVKQMNERSGLLLPEDYYQQLEEEEYQW